MNKLYMIVRVGNNPYMKTSKLLTKEELIEYSNLEINKYVKERDMDWDSACDRYFDWNSMRYYEYVPGLDGSCKNVRRKTVEKWVRNEKNTRLLE